MFDDLVRASRTGVGGALRVLTLNRPRSANAYTTEMLRVVADELAAARADASVRGLIVTGTDGVFCAGADLEELGSRKGEDALALLSRDVFDALAQAPWPTVAAVNGPAVGGGFELALACDFRCCAENAFFQLPELGHGLLPAAGGIRRLCAELGVTRVKELVLLGQRLDAATAMSWGIASQVTAHPLDAAIALLESTVRFDPIAVRAAKLLVEETFETQRGRTTEALAQAFLYARRASAP